MARTWTWALAPALATALASPLAMADTGAKDKAWTLAGSLGASQLSGLGSYCDGTTTCTTRPVGWALVLGKGLGSGWSVEGSLRSFGIFEGRIPSDPAKAATFEPFEDPQPKKASLYGLSFALSAAYSHAFTPELTLKARLGAGNTLTSYLGYSNTETFFDIFDNFFNIEAYAAPVVGLELGYAVSPNWQLTAGLDHTRARAISDLGDQKSKVFGLTQYSLGARYTF